MLESPQKEPRLEDCPSNTNPSKINSITQSQTKFQTEKIERKSSGTSKNEVFPINRSEENIRGALHLPEFTKSVLLPILLWESCAWPDAMLLWDQTVLLSISHVLELGKFSGKHCFFASLFLTLRPLDGPSIALPSADAVQHPSRLLFCYTPCLNHKVKNSILSKNFLAKASFNIFNQILERNSGTTKTAASIH